MPRHEQTFQFLEFRVATCPTSLTHLMRTTIGIQDDTDGTTPTSNLVQRLKNGVTARPPLHLHIMTCSFVELLNIAENGQTILATQAKTVYGFTTGVHKKKRSYASQSKTSTLLYRQSSLRCLINFVGFIFTSFCVYSYTPARPG